MPLSFYDWMQSRYQLKDSAGVPMWKNSRFGDLAYDMYRDQDHFPRSCAPDEILDYFELAFSTNSVWGLRTARDALSRYRKYLKTVQKRMLKNVETQN